MSRGATPAAPFGRRPECPEALERWLTKALEFDSHGKPDKEKGRLRQFRAQRAVHDSAELEDPTDVEERLHTSHQPALHAYAVERGFGDAEIRFVEPRGSPCGVERASHLDLL